MHAFVLTFAVVAAAAAESVPAASPADRPSWFLAVLGGAGPVGGSLDSFTQTGSAPRRTGSTPFTGVSGGALRVGLWGPGSPWGAALEGSRLVLRSGGGEATVWAGSALMLARPPFAARWRVFPYAGLGATAYSVDAYADHRPRTAADLRTVEFDWPYGPWTFDARLGVSGRLDAVVSLLFEARFTRFALDRAWTPASWFGPPAVNRAGVSMDALPLLLQAGASFEFGAPSPRR